MDPALESYQTPNEWQFSITNSAGIDFGGNWAVSTNHIANTGAGGAPCSCIQLHECPPTEIRVCWLTVARLAFHVMVFLVADITIASFLNKWVHIGAAYSSSGQLTRAYVNGAFLSTVGAGQWFRGDPNPEIWLGVRPATSTGAAPGLWVDDVRVWSGVALSDAQMAAEFASAAPVTTAGLAAWFPFDADAAGGTAAVDSKHSLAMTMSAGAKVDVARTIPSAACVVLILCSTFVPIFLQHVRVL